MNGSVHRNVRQRLLLFYHIYGRKPEKNYNTYTKKSHNRNPEKLFKHKIKKLHRYTYQKQKIPIA
jgi:hypothetical protein